MTEITSRKNPRALHLKKLGADRDYRRSRGEYLCDGAKLLREAVAWGADIHEILFCGDLPPELPAGVRVYRTSREVIESVSPLKTPQEVVFSVGIPPQRGEPDIAGAVILENIQDPGNLGTVLRTANAFDIPAVVLVGECADVWSPKTVRASMGAVFRQRVLTMTLDELREAAGRTPVYGAALRSGAQDIRRAGLSHCAVAIGNEGSGLTRELLDLCAGTVIVPMSPRCESLNAAVAAAVIMWELKRDEL